MAGARQARRLADPAWWGCGEGQCPCSVQLKIYAINCLLALMGINLVAWSLFTHYELSGRVNRTIVTIFAMKPHVISSHGVHVYVLSEALLRPGPKLVISRPASGRHPPHQGTASMQIPTQDMRQ